MAVEGDRYSAEDEAVLTALRLGGGETPSIHFRNEVTMFIAFLALSQANLDFLDTLRRHRTTAKWLGTWQRTAPRTVRVVLGSISIVLELASTIAIWLYWRVPNPERGLYITTLALYIIYVLSAQLLYRVLLDNSYVIAALRLVSSLGVLFLLCYEAWLRHDASVWAAVGLWAPNLVVCVLVFALAIPGQPATGPASQHTRLDDDTARHKF